MSKMFMYKQFRQDKNGSLHPLFVSATETIPIGVWLQAKEGERREDGKVKSRLGGLAYRPGWHLSELPLATHIGEKVDGKIKYMHDDTVWALCEVWNENDYTILANEQGFINGKFDPKLAYLKKLPKDGFYFYRTNPQCVCDWIICDQIKVIKVLTDEDCERICWTKAKMHALPHKKGA